jgi:hypothetical protein
MSTTLVTTTSPALVRVLVGVVAFASLTTATGAAAAATSADSNAHGIPFSAVDRTAGIGVVAKTLSSPLDANVHGIPLSALDQTLGLRGLTP